MKKQKNKSLKVGTRVRCKDKYGRLLEGYIKKINTTYDVVFTTDENFKPTKYYGQTYGTEERVEVEYHEWGKRKEDLEIV